MAYDTRDFVANTRRHGFTPDVSADAAGRCIAIDGRTGRHRDYQA